MFRHAQQKIMEVSFSHPITFMTTTVGASVVLGLVCLGVVERRMEDNLQLTNEEKEMIGIGAKSSSTGNCGDTSRQQQRSISREEARVRAMIENAKESDWKQNLSNAIEAQHQFMLPAESKRSMDKPEFIKKIDRRTDEMMKLQEEEEDEELLLEQRQINSKRESTSTRFWK